MNNLTDCKEEVMQQIHEKLKELETEDLNQVFHVLSALEAAKVGGLHYYGRFLGIEWNGQDEVKMNLGLQNANVYGVAQGGALYTLADVAIGHQIISKLSPDENVYTLEMKVNYLRPGTGNVLTAKPDFLHWGRTTVVAQCRIEDDKGDLVAHALGTFYINRRKEGRHDERALKNGLQNM